MQTRARVLDGTLFASASRCTGYVSLATVQVTPPSRCGWRQNGAGAATVSSAGQPWDGRCIAACTARLQSLPALPAALPAAIGAGSTPSSVPAGDLPSLNMLVQWVPFNGFLPCIMFFLLHLAPRQGSWKPVCFHSSSDGFCPPCSTAVGLVSPATCSALKHCSACTKAPKAPPSPGKGIFASSP